MTESFMFNDKLNWKHDNGINLFMLNDIQRNRFYDMSLADKVNDKICVDIGFGTGLLSFIALKHGAKKIIGYESDLNRYYLGKHIIKELKLDDKIDLRRANFSSNRITDDREVVYLTETVCQNLWGEQLLNSLPRKKNITFIPNNLFFEIHAVEISTSYKRKLFDFRDLDGFEPSVDISDDFINLINNLGFNEFKTKETSNNNCINEFNFQASYFGHNSYLNFTNDSTKIAEYKINVKDLEITIKDNLNSRTEEINFDNEEIDLYIGDKNWKTKNILVVPKVGLQNYNHKLYLDKGHWGPMVKPVILNNCSNIVKVTHNLTNGELSYNLE